MKKTVCARIMCCLLINILPSLPVLNASCAVVLIVLLSNQPASPNNPINQLQPSTNNYPPLNFQPSHHLYPFTSYRLDMAKYNKITGHPVDSKNAANTENILIPRSLSGPPAQRRSRPMAHQIMPMAYSEHPQRMPMRISALRSQGERTMPEGSANFSERERF